MITISKLKEILNSKLGPPQDIEIKINEANVIVCNWKEPEWASNYSVLRYTIYFTRDPGLTDENYKEWISVNVSSNQTNYRMSDHVLFRPKTLYRMRITASNNIGESLPSEVFEFETASHELPVPTDVQVHVNNDSSVTIFFTAVRNSINRSLYVEDYEVSISPSTDAFAAQFLSVPVTDKFFNNMNAMIALKIASKNFIPNTQYWLIVRAKIEGRRSPSSIPRLITLS
ncbi:unnamed protein product [Dracunculus medinensis]|uniref:Fibronectin type-III domain-containing protein n=1 Tax=Dracunculus medinensis TaxID=318479 RepID=A0A0N4UG25_DRAME|nr:unnamed protein product [Dracunculus medinensis]